MSHGIICIILIIKESVTLNLYSYQLPDKKKKLN